MIERELREAAGRCLFLGVHAVEPDAALHRFLDDLRPGGLILFPRNLQEASQIVRLNEALRGGDHLPRLVGVDQEGGRVERLRPILGRLPAAAEIARGGADAAGLFGELLGRALRSLGFNLNFAPVLDLSPVDAANGIGDRAFSADPAVVARLGGAYLEGLARAGLVGVMKHFPGLGSTEVDSHESLPVVSKPEAPFRREDLRPFVEIAPLAPAVMIGHAHYPFLEPSRLPASASRRVIQDLLRTELGYTGVAIADDLEMGAVDQGENWAAAAAATVAAGCDMVLVCHSVERMTLLRDRLVEDVLRGRLPEQRLQEAASRIDALRSRTCAPDGEDPGRAQEALRERFASLPRPGPPPEVR